MRTVDPEALAYPVMILGDGLVVPRESADLLTRATAAALRRGYPRGLRLVDAAGTVYVLTGARKIGGVGPFGGLNLFLDRRLRIALEGDRLSEKATLDEVRQAAIKMSRRWFPDTTECNAAIGKATSFSEIAEALQKRLGRSRLG